MFTTLPTVKGGVTLPAKIRKKYHIGKTTPLRITDEGGGIIKITVMKMSDYDAIDYRETASSMNISFPKGIDPDVIIKKIEQLDG